MFDENTMSYSQYKDKIQKTILAFSGKRQSLGHFSVLIILSDIQIRGPGIFKKEDFPRAEKMAKSLNF